jgi:transposase
MSAPIITLPDNVESLRDLAREQGSKIKELEQVLKLQREMIRLLRIAKFGSKSEKLNDAQLQFLDEEPGVHQQEVEDEVKQEKKLRRKKRNPSPGRIELPEHLERIDEIIGCSPDQCRCGQCGGDTHLVGYNQSEVLDVKPAEYFVRVIKREKRACQSCPEAGVLSAAAPGRIMEKGKLSDAFIIDVTLKKYRDHNPLYRQSINLLEDAGVGIHRSTLCGNVMKVGELCAPIAGAMKTELFAGGYIQADETPIGVLSAEVTGKNHKGYMFEYSRPYELVIFEFRMGRGREGPREFLKGFEGQLQCDGYSGYNEFDNEKIQRIGCMAHIRRKFVDAHKVAKNDPRPAQIIAGMKGLYKVEKEAREAGLDAAQRRALRQEKSAELMKTLQAQILELRQAVLPASALGKACSYALNQWQRVSRYLEYGQVEIDNNLCENGIRPLAVGRKNWLHIGGEEAGPKIAGILSIVETCRRLKINVRDYMMDVLPGLAERDQSELPQMTPAAWKARQATA